MNKTPDGYQWERIVELKAGCALCTEIMMDRCYGNKEGKACERYNCRDINHCKDCPHFDPKKNYCSTHMVTVGAEDYDCYMRYGKINGDAESADDRSCSRCGNVFHVPDGSHVCTSKESTNYGKKITETHPCDQYKPMGNMEVEL